jgi:X-X-X-Leu-X-X-Gly heptad repeat protein
MKGEDMKLRTIAVSSALAVMLIGGTIASQVAMLTPVYAEEASLSSAQIEGTIIEGAAEKEEVVYASMTASGEVKHLYVVNELFSDVPILVRDFGSYDDAINLTDEATLERDNDSVVCLIEEESFTYQGNLASTDLPWDISISYELDGQSLSPGELAGKSGSLRILIETSRNMAIDQAYYDNYMLQITCTLPIDHATHVATEQGALALAGSDTSVSFTGMPGKDGSFSLTAQVKDFEMEGISIAAIPFSMVLDMPDSSALVSQFDELIAGTEKLKRGAGELEAGTSTFSDGVKKLDEGTAQLKDGSGELSSGVAAYVAGVTRLSQGLMQAAEGSTSFAAKLQELADASARVLQSLAQNQSQIQSLVAQIQASSLSDAEKAALLQQVEGMSSQLADLKHYAEGVEQLSSGYAQIDGSIAQLSSGLAELSTKGDELIAGSSELEAGVSELAGSTDSLTQGADRLANGTSALAEGTDLLHEESQRIPDKVRSEIDALMSDYDKSDFAPQSFVDARNTNVQLVQFVMTTEAIHLPDPEPEETEEQDETLLSRFFALFS